MSGGRDSVGLTVEQCVELRRAREGFDLALRTRHDPIAGFGVLVSIYLDVLNEVAACELHGVVCGGGPVVHAEGHRALRRTIAQMERHLGRKPAAEDLLKPLCEVVEVSADLAKAIRRHLEGLTT
jgi:hypothetical protein